MYDRFTSGGEDSLADHELLEMYLFGCIPRRNTNDIAHALINRFGSLDAVFDADIEALITVGGINRGSAVKIRLMSALSRRYYILKSNHKRDGLGREQIGEYLVNRFHMVSSECILLLCFTASMKLIGTRMIANGTVTSAQINIRKIAESALSCGASCIVLAHNHPGGKAEPSDFDITTTRMVKRALDLIDLPLVEHYIVSGKEYCTLLGYKDTGI